MAERLKAADCKSALIEYVGSNPTLPTIFKQRVAPRKYSPQPELYALLLPATQRTLGARLCCLKFFICREYLHMTVKT